MEFFNDLLVYPYWLWATLGAVLFVFELLAPGAFFLWLGLGAFSTALVLLWVPKPLSLQLMLFAFLSIGWLWVWRRFFLRPPSEAGEHPMLNQRGARYIGRIVVLDKPIVDGQGILNLDDTLWKITGPDLVAGERVKIIKLVDGILIVEAVKA